jgi:hypothetical protein
VEGSKRAVMMPDTGVPLLFSAGVTGTARGLRQGTHTVLKWYSHGTALPRRARKTPSDSCGSLSGTQRAQCTHPTSHAPCRSQCQRPSPCRVVPYERRDGRPLGSDAPDAQQPIHSSLFTAAYCGGLG